MENELALKYLNALNRYKNGGALRAQFGLSKDLEAIETLHKMRPHVLYKYRKFDNYTDEMLAKPYLFLAPPISLDDPFECSLRPIEDFLNDNHMTEIVIMAAKRVFKEAYNRASQGIRPIISRIYGRWLAHPTSRIDFNLFTTLLGDVNENEKADAIQIFNAINQFFASLDADSPAGSTISPALALIISMRKNGGICSLAEENDNQALWSMYADGYKGYCVGYEIKESAFLSGRVLPVTYDKNRYTDPVQALVDSFVDKFLMVVSKGSLKWSGPGLIQVILIKDSCWSFQNEWRLIGEKGEKFSDFKISGIYIGPNASKKDIDSMLKYGFPVYRGRIERREAKIVFEEVGNATR